jgi:hypothetical protein
VLDGMGSRGQQARKQGHGVPPPCGPSEIDMALNAGLHLLPEAAA